MPSNLRSHSLAVIRSGQAPTGAFIASPNFSTYHYSWLRDGAFIAYALDRAGAHDSALAFHRWVDATLRSVAHKVDVLEAKAAGRESNVRGYKVKVDFRKVDDAEKQAKKKALSQVILDSLKKMKK
jgi:GH15 family glucan-1,4-alpha-glucosidase